MSVPAGGAFAADTRIAFPRRIPARLRRHARLLRSGDPAWRRSPKWKACRSAGSCTHGEKAAAYMADGYARASRRPGVCMAQHIGASNLAAGLRDPFLACSPVLAITGGGTPQSRYRNAYQELEDMSQFDRTTKVQRPRRRHPPVAGPDAPSVPRGDDWLAGAGPSADAGSLRPSHRTGCGSRSRDRATVQRGAGLSLAGRSGAGREGSATASAGRAADHRRGRRCDVGRTPPRCWSNSPKRCRFRLRRRSMPAASSRTSHPLAVGRGRRLSAGLRQ